MKGQKEVQGADITETQLHQPPQPKKEKPFPQKVAGETVSKHSAQGLSSQVLEVLTEPVR